MCEHRQIQKRIHINKPTYQNKKKREPLQNTAQNNAIIQKIRKKMKVQHIKKSKNNEHLANKKTQQDKIKTYF